MIRTYLDLSTWWLALPVDVDGLKAGLAAHIKNLLGYENRQYFFRAEDGAQVFVAMADGATTGGSRFARSELREMNGDEKAAWRLSEGGTMTATLEVDRAPMRFDGTYGKMVIGQIHGGDEQLVRLYWDNGRIYFVNDMAANGQGRGVFDVYDPQGDTPQVSFNERFSYQIDAYQDTLVVKVFADGKTYTSVTSIHESWQDNEFYFKAGVYLGVNETTGSGEGQTSFYGLDIGHTQGLGLAGLLPLVDHSDNLVASSGSGRDRVLGNSAIALNNEDDQALSDDTSLDMTQLIEVSVADPIAGFLSREIEAPVVNSSDQAQASSLPVYTAPFSVHTDAQIFVADIYS